MTDPLGQTTNTAYYPNGQVERVRDPLGHTTTYQYDPADRPTVVTDANGHSTTTTYLTASRQITVQDPTGAIVTTLYDAAGRRSKLTDGNGHVTTFLYDTAGRLETTIDPLSRSTTLSYDGANNVITKQDARPLTASFEYDHNNRKTSETYPDYAATYAYDAVGNRTHATDSLGSYVTTFTARNQVMAVTDPHSQTVAYEYDANRNRIQMTDPSSGIYTSTVDAAGRLVVVQNPRDEYTSYTYDVNERLTNTALDSGGNEARGYDAADRLTSVVTNDALGSVQTAYTYSLDAVGNRKQVNDYVNGVSQYAYTARNELTQETLSAGPLAWMTLTLAEWLAFTLDQWDAFVLNATPITTMDYTYDAVGNRKTAKVGSVTTTYAYDAANQLHTGVDSTGLHTTYTYDGAGNMVSQNAGGTVTTHVYNGPNRLVEVQSPTAGDATFVYDPDGRRVQKESTSENTRFIWDAERLLRETDTAGETTVDYTQSATGSGEGSFGNLVSEYQSGTGTTYQHAFDGLGSTGALLDSSGSAVDRWQYSALGLQQSAPEDPPTRMSYSGQKGYQFDLELDLYYCRNRYYDPALGRWLNKDPAQADELNNYRYVGNNPVTKSDWSGLADEEPLYPALQAEFGATNAQVRAAIQKNPTVSAKLASIEATLKKADAATADMFHASIAMDYLENGGEETPAVKAGLSMLGTDSPPPAPHPQPPKGLGLVSGTFAAKAEEGKEERTFSGAIKAMYFGTLAVPAALVDTVPGAIKQSSAQARDEIRQKIAKSNDPIVRIAGNVAIGGTHVGEVFAQFGNATAVAAPALVAAEASPAVGAILSNSYVVAGVGATGTVLAGKNAINQYRQGTLSGSDVFFVGAGVLTTAHGARSLLGSSPTDFPGVLPKSGDVQIRDPRLLRIIRKYGLNPTDTSVSDADALNNQVIQKTIQFHISPLEAME